MAKKPTVKRGREPLRFKTDRTFEDAVSHVMRVGKPDKGWPKAAARKKSNSK